MRFDPTKHHRRSIRLKGHEYAGGGVYFVTLCAHREAVAWGAGQPFGQIGEGALRGEEGALRGEEGALRGEEGALRGARTVIAEEWLRCGEIRDDVIPGEFVVMPDHFHGLIRIEKGKSALGNVIGAFKASVTRRLRRGDPQVAPSPECAPSPGGAPRIWHRNYYERIVRSEEAKERIADYIRMNPWRCVQDFGVGQRGIGNPALWNGEKLGVLCSRSAHRIGHIPGADVYFGGWHSPNEKEILEWLLNNGQRVIACPAWGIEDSGFAPGVREALAENRMLILEMRDVSGNLAAAEARNRFVLEHSDALFTPHVAQGGMLDRLLNEFQKAN